METKMEYIVIVAVVAIIAVVILVLRTTSQPVAEVQQPIAGEATKLGSCEDTDGGFIPKLYGRVTEKHNFSAYYDDCLNKTTVLEYYCTGPSLAESRLADCFAVRLSCLNGQCQ